MSEYSPEDQEQPRDRSGQWIVAFLLIGLIIIVGIVAYQLLTREPAPAEAPTETVQVEVKEPTLDIPKPSIDLPTSDIDVPESDADLPDVDLPDVDLPDVDLPEIGGDDDPEPSS